MNILLRIKTDPGRLCKSRHFCELGTALRDMHGRKRHDETLYIWGRP